MGNPKNFSNDQKVLAEVRSSHESEKVMTMLSGATQAFDHSTPLLPKDIDNEYV